MQQPGKSSLRTLLWWIALPLAFIGVVYGLVRLGGGTTSQSTLTLDKPTASDHVKGNVDAPVVLIEYSDFQCPACAFYYSVVQQLEQTFGDRLALVYRHFPLKTIHENAEAAAHAAEAAGKQDKFFEMHDALFENQERWSDTKDPEVLFVTYAESLGLDASRFREDMQSQPGNNVVDEHYQSGIKANVSGTPTFFLNGRKIRNPRTFEDFKKIIDEALAT